MSADTATAPLLRKPAWLKVRPPDTLEAMELRRRLKSGRMHTICREAACPNQGRCWGEGSAAFLILGERCTRNCTFCNVDHGRPSPVDPEEPWRLAETARDLGLRHVVITSVTRDDLSDGGAGHFRDCLGTLRAEMPVGTTLEVLTPDFIGKPMALERVLSAEPDVFNHNIETVPRLYGPVRPGGNYVHALGLLERAARHGGRHRVKSGLMAGLGESSAEIEAVLGDLYSVGVRLLTIGQYLQPSRRHHPVKEYWRPEQFEAWRMRALEMGFQAVQSHPLARSSFHAEETFHAGKGAVEAKRRA